MTFRIFAAGTGHFHYERNGLDFGDVYDVGSVLSQMQDLASGGPAGWAQGQATGAVTPDSLQAALNTLGLLIGAHLLRESVEYMIVERGEVDVSVYARQARTFWVDNAQFTRMHLTADDDSPARTFFRRVNPVLAETEMNTFGVLAGMAAAITQFSIDGGSGANGVTMLNIQLFR